VQCAVRADIINKKKHEQKKSIFLPFLYIVYDKKLFRPKEDVEKKRNMKK